MFKTAIFRNNHGTLKHFNLQASRAYLVPIEQVKVNLSPKT